MSGWFGTKKRKANEVDNDIQAEANHDIVNKELIEMKSTMHEMMNQNTQMMQLMSSIQGEMKT